MVPITTLTPRSTSRSAYNHSHPDIKRRVATLTSRSPTAKKTKASDQQHTPTKNSTWRVCQICRRNDDCADIPQHECGQLVSHFDRCVAAVFAEREQARSEHELRNTAHKSEVRDQPPPMHYYCGCESQ